MRDSLKMEIMSRYPFHLTYMKIILHYLMFHLSYFTKQTHIHTHNSLNMLKQAAALNIVWLCCNFFFSSSLQHISLAHFYYGCCKCLSTCIPLYVHPHKKNGNKRKKKMCFLEFRGILDREVMAVCVYIQQGKISYCENAFIQSY